MAQAVSRRPPTVEARVLSRVGSCGICGGQSGTGAGFSPSSSVFPCQFRSTGAPLLGKGQKIIIIFIIGLHKKPHDCGESVTSAAGPFTTKKKSPSHPETEIHPFRFGVKIFSRSIFTGGGAKIFTPRPTNPAVGRCAHLLVPKLIFISGAVPLLLCIFMEWKWETSRA
jgi:hypothetical protein